MKKYLIAPVTAGIMLAVAGAAQAASKDTTFTVTATVAKACTISAGDLDMGTWDNTGNLNGASTITVKCTKDAPFDVGLSAGANSTDGTARFMAAGPDLLAYNLYSDSARTQVWGNTIDTDTVPGIGAGMANANELDLRVYARVQLADLQAAKAGEYTDTVTATITY